jgi:diphthine synthase
MLFIIGLGVDPKNTAPVFINYASSICEKSYFDNYTTFVKNSELEWIEKKLNAVPVSRETLEDIDRFVEEARNKNVCLYVYGDPYVATTHQALKVYATENNINVKTIYSSSFINVIFGETGLHIYKIGFVGSLIKGDINSRNYIYKQIGTSLELKKHSIIIPTGYEGNVRSLLHELKQAENNFKEEVFTDDRFVVLVSRAGTEEEKILGGKLFELLQSEIELEEPFTLIVPGALHFTEEEVLKKIHNILPSQNLKPSALEIRTQKIVEKCRIAIENAKQDSIIKKYKDVFENAVLYIKDAEEAQRKGDQVTALMQAAYAEGLIDALRFLGEKIRWE